MRHYLKPMEVPVVSASIFEPLYDNPNEPCYLTLDFKRSLNASAKIKPHLFQLNIDKNQNEYNKINTIYGSSITRKPTKSMQCPRNMMYQSFYATRRAHKQPNKIEKPKHEQIEQNKLPKSQIKRYSVLDYLQDANTGEINSLDRQEQRFKSVDFQSRRRQRNHPNNPFQINFKNKKKLSDLYSPRSRPHKKGNSLFEKLSSIAYQEDQGYPRIKPAIKGQAVSRIADAFDKQVYKAKQKKKLRTKVIQL